MRIEREAPASSASMRRKSRLIGESELSIDFAELLRQGGPWGQGFPEPVFDDRFAVVSKQLMGDCHVKLQLCHPGKQQAIDAIAFNHASGRQLPDWEQIHAAYRLDINEFRGKRSLQLILEHVTKVNDGATAGG